MSEVNRVLESHEKANKRLEELDQIIGVLSEFKTQDDGFVYIQVNGATGFRGPAFRIQLRAIKEEMEREQAALQERVNRLEYIIGEMEAVAQDGQDG